MVLGQYVTKFSSKGRVALPKKFRDELGEKLIVARWYEGCLVVVGEEGWSVLLNKLTGKLDRITHPVRDTDRFILGSAFEIEVDGQGRFVVPPTLRTYADLKEEVVFLGLGNRVELWDKVAWMEHERKLSTEASQLVEEMSREDERRQIP